MESLTHTPLGLQTNAVKRQVRLPIRVSLAEQVDVPTLARLILLAFEKDEYEPVLFPHRVGLTTAQLLAQDGPPEERRFRRKLVGHVTHIKATVQIEDDQGHGRETIVGWASWSTPTGVRRRSLWEWLWSEVIYPLHRFLFRPTLGAGLPRQAKDIFASQHDAVFGPGGTAEGRKHWYLHVICVDPDWQGMGVGSALLEWGFSKARENDAAIYLESSPAGLPVYLAKGFRIANVQPGEVNGVIVKIPGMIWEPVISRRSATAGGV